MVRQQKDISQDEYYRQVAWLDNFLEEQRDWKRLNRLAAEFGFKLIPKKAQP